MKLERSQTLRGQRHTTGLGVHLDKKFFAMRSLQEIVASNLQREKEMLHSQEECGDELVFPTSHSHSHSLEDPGSFSSDDKIVSSGNSYFTLGSWEAEKARQNRSTSSDSFANFTPGGPYSSLSTLDPSITSSSLTSSMVGHSSLLSAFNSHLHSSLQHGSTPTQVNSMHSPPSQQDTEGISTRSPQHGGTGGSAQQRSMLASPQHGNMGSSSPLHAGNQLRTTSSLSDNHSSDSKEVEEDEKKSKKAKVDYHTLFSSIRNGRPTDEIEFVDVEDQPSNSVFRFTEEGIKFHREGLQKLCRENYKRLRELGVKPFGDNSKKQKVVYSRRLFQLTDLIPVPKSDASCFSELTLAAAEKVHILAFGDLFPSPDESGIHNALWVAFFSKISQGKKVKLLLPDPRFMGTQGHSSQLLMVIERLYDHINKNSNLQIRLFQDVVPFCGCSTNEQTKCLTLMHSSYSTVNQSITNDLKTQYYLRYWKPNWSRAIKAVPPVIRTLLGSAPAKPRIVSNQAETLRRLFSLQYSVDRVDSKVVAFRNQCFGSTDFANLLQLTGKKVDLYGVALESVFSDPNFTGTILEHLETTLVKFRILLKDPSGGTEALDSMDWGDRSHMDQTLKTLLMIRDQMSDRHLFDSKCQIRLHHSMNYFSYFRFDEMLTIAHHSGPFQANSFVHQHWKGTNHKAQPHPSLWKDFADVFKKVWDEAIPLPKI